MWDGLFGFTNALALVGWAVLAFLPRKPLAHSFVLFLGVGLLCLIYAVSFALFLSGAVAPGGSGAGGTPGFGSIPEVRALFETDAGVVIGWTHYLAFDLFAGLWIARDGDAKDFSRLAQLPFLALTLMAGPVGLLAWLMTRESRARKLGRG